MQILRDLGYLVTPVTSLRRVPHDSDLYFTWWWGSGFPTLLKSIPAGRPNVFTGALHYGESGSYFSGGPPSPETLTKRLLTRLSLRLASANIFISKHEFQNVQRFRVNRPYLVPPCIDTAFYKPDQGAEADCLLTISHMNHANVRRKRILEIVDAFALIVKNRPTERLVIVGELLDGYPIVRAKVERLGLGDHVHFAGRVGRAEKLELLRRAKVYLQPSTYEGFGYAIGEAMACQVPVIVSATGAITELVGDTGVYVADGAPAGIAGAIFDVLGAPAKAAELGARARKRIHEVFSYELRKEGIRRVLEDVSSSSRPRDWKVPPL
jgi:glycosyltransferase involved in cell wall biosynthesis